jgi:hypothetical protein
LILGDAVVALETRNFRFQPRDVMRLGDLWQRHDIRTAAHDGSEVIHAVLLQRIDAHRNDGARGPPGSIEIGRERPRLRS